MKHICNAKSGKYEFGIALDASIDNPGMYRLIDENDGSEIIDMMESEENAIEAIYNMYPDNDM